MALTTIGCRRWLALVRGLPPDSAFAWSYQNAPAEEPQHGAGRRFFRWVQSLKPPEKG